MLLPLFFALTVFGSASGFANTNPSPKNLTDPAATAPIFSAHTPLELTFTAPFKRLSEADQATEDEYPIEIRDLANPSHRILGTVSERGMSSKWPGEGDFPKLKLDLDRASTRDTLLDESRKIRVNTHVSTYPTRRRTPLGRLNDERSPYREALVFELGRALGLPMHHTRRAQITYKDSETGATYRRMALFIESDKALVKRHNAREIKADEFEQKQETGISFEQSAKINFFQGLIGNDDYFFRTHEEAPHPEDPVRGLGNIFVMEHPDGTRTLVPYDFDLSTMVSGEGRLKNFWPTYPELGCNTEVESYQCWNNTSIRTRHPAADVEKAVQFFKDNRMVIERVIAEAIIDDIGRRVAQRHVERFYRFLDRSI